MTKRKCVIDETITCEDFQCDNCPVKDAYNYGLAEGRKEVEAENKVLKQIIQDLLAHTDGCECCTAKGQHAPACECRHDAECVEHMIKLYTEVK